MWRFSLTRLGSDYRSYANWRRALQGVGSGLLLCVKSVPWASHNLPRTEQKKAPRITQPVPQSGGSFGVAFMTTIWRGARKFPQECWCRTSPGQSNFPQRMETLRNSSTRRFFEHAEAGKSDYGMCSACQTAGSFRGSWILLLCAGWVRWPRGFGHCLTSLSVSGGFRRGHGVTDDEGKLT